MVPSLRDLTYEERLGLLSLKGRREREDFITVCRVMKEMETFDKVHLLVWDVGETRG